MKERMSIPQQTKIQQAQDLLKAQVDGGAVPAVSLAVSGVELRDTWAYGRLDDKEGAPLVDPDTRFVVASLTKPVTAAATMRLVEEGELTLATPVAAVLPGFSSTPWRETSLWHLLTHTSGLPDMAPANLELRREHADLDAFLENVRTCERLFRPGERVSYQSTGSLVMSKIVEHITGKAFRRFVAEEIFVPAGMTRSTLGLDDAEDPSTDAQIDLPESQKGASWGWNSLYWRRLGAPWGGLTSTAGDMLRFINLFLLDGRSRAGRRVLAEATVRSMTRDRLSALGRGFAPWGLGWKVKGSLITLKGGPEHDPAKPLPAERNRDVQLDAGWEQSFMGDVTSDETFGHAGATGCVMWADPGSRMAVTALSSSPNMLRGGLFCRVANILSS